MANVLKKEIQVQIIGALAEGNSIRSIERQTGVHRDTVMRLGVRIGEGCKTIMDEKMRDLPCKLVQVDEIWGFVGKKQKNVKRGDPNGSGDCWTFVAIDADSKVVPTFRVGDRTPESTTEFLTDLAGRMTNRIQLTSDSLHTYKQAVTAAFGVNRIDYAQLVKSYALNGHKSERKYSPAQLVKVDKARVFGQPVASDISTSFVERQNLTMRHHCKRLARLTLAFSKKIENLRASVGLYFAYYNFCKVHKTIRCTPAMAAGVVPSIWTVAELVDMVNG